MSRAHLLRDPHDEPGSDQDYFDPVEFFAHHGELERAAEHIADGDIYRKAVLGLDPIEALELERHLAERGLAMFDDGEHWLFIAPDICAGPRKRSDRDADAPAPAPTEPLCEEPTLAQCAHGPHPAAGPPEPFCCEGRKRQILKLEAGEHPAFRDEDDHDDEEGL